jgi:hypothetical protein
LRDCHKDAELATNVLELALEVGQRPAIS